MLTLPCMISQSFLPETTFWYGKQKEKKRISWRRGGEVGSEEEQSLLAYLVLFFVFLLFFLGQFTPLLPSVTVGTIEARSIVESIRKFCKRSKKHNITFYEAEATDFVLDQNKVKCKGRY